MVKLLIVNQRTGGSNPPFVEHYQTQDRKMKVEIWCIGGPDVNMQQHVSALRVWAGEMDYVPRVGDLVEVVDGWASETILDVIHKVSENMAIIEIQTDTHGEYRREIMEKE